MPVSRPMNAANLLYPYVVPASWVEFASTEALVSWQMSEDVHLVLVFDGQGTVQSASPRVLSDLGLDPDEAFDVAAYHLGQAWQRLEFDLGLATLGDGTRIGCARGNWMAPAAATTALMMCEMHGISFHEEPYRIMSGYFQDIS